jgi:hypothetical protein
MARRRYTKSDLGQRIEAINGWFEADGSTIRFEVGGRNGYTAVDQYSVDADGNRKGSSVDRNIGCGTPRECAEYAATAYSNEYRTRISRENDSLRAENAELKAQA